MNYYNWPKITRDTPLEEIKRIHQQIWDYVIEHGEKPNTPYLSDCVACEYVCTHIGDPDYDPTCSNCPIDWPNAICKRLSSLYGSWHIATQMGQVDQATAIAKMIRDIPFKFEQNTNKE